MRFNLFKFAFRSMSRQKSLTMVNMFGLVAGLCISIVIFQYVHYHRSFDSFQDEDVYRVRLDFISTANIKTSYSTSFRPLGEELTKAFAEVEDYGFLITVFGGKIFTTSDQKTFDEPYAYYAHPGLFRVLNFDVVDGNPETDLAQPGKAFISTSTALKYFGNEDPIGKVIKRNFDQEIEVAGVFRDFPDNSHLQPTILISYETFRPDEPPQLLWRGYITNTYVKINRGADVTELSKKIEPFISRFRETAWKVIPVLQPIEAIHTEMGILSSDITSQNTIDPQTLFFLSIMAVLIMLIVWINYMNLYIASSLKRIKEVGIRKVLGSGRIQLILQFVAEAVLMNVASLFIALLIIWLCSNKLSEYIGIQLPELTLSSGLIYFIGFLLLGGILTSIYPAVRLSSFKPLQSFKGVDGSKASKGIGLRDVLIVFQYLASTVLIVFTLGVFDQVNFMRAAALGIDTERVFVVKGPSVRGDDYIQKMEIFRDELSAIGGVQSVALSSDVPGSELGTNVGGVRQVSREEGNQLQMFYVDPDFADFYDLKFITGRNFSFDLQTDIGKVFLNEKALRLLDYDNAESAIGTLIRIPRGEVQVIGVIEDFHLESVKENIPPIIFRYRPQDFDHVSIKVSGGDALTLRNQTESFFQAHFPGEIYESFFLEDHFDRQYQSDITFGRIFGLFASVALVIASLGLLGLISHMISKRLKEISIRKVLGANLSTLIILLSRRFTYLIIAAELVALPLSYIWLNSWLDAYAQRMSIDLMILIVPVLMIVLITGLNIIYLGFKATMTNPILHLRAD